MVTIVADVDPLLLELLRQDGRIDFVYTPCFDAPSLAAAVGEARIIVTRYHNRLTREILEAAPRLELIVQGTSGLDNIDLDAARERGIVIRGIPGENANAVAELVIGHMIHLTRTVGSYTRSVREGEWLRDDCATRQELRAYRLGIVGLGRVGSRVARLAHAFGMRPAAVDPYLEDVTFGAASVTRATTLESLLRHSDIVTFHVPLTSETRGMIGAAQLDLLPPGAFVINTSRGPVVDIPAVLERLESGRIAGAAFDVFDPEPPDGIAWPDDPRLILTPHIAGCTREAKESLARAAYGILCTHFGIDPR